MIDQFLRSFSHLRSQPIALYGLGANTQRLLDSVEGFNIVGLMDPENIGRQVFGLPVLSKEEAATQVKAIVIVARTAVIPIIHARIAELAKSGIAIYDLGGNLLSSRPHAAQGQWRAKPGSDEDALRRAIDEADVHSFDIFDTLLMRQVARPENVFDLVESRTRSLLPPDVHFKSERMAAERAAAEHSPAPGIAAIYRELAARLNLTADEAATLMAEEIAAETQVLVRREAMVKHFDYAVAAGKPVYLVSDMYLGKEILSGILQAKGIAGYRDLIVSCDMGQTKRSGELFSVLKTRAASDNILHIGDDPVADIEAPKRLGIETFPIASGYEMLLASPFAHLLSRVASPADALALGMVIARAFNDPFLFHRTQGRPEIAAGHDLGFIGFGAMVAALLQWIVEQTCGRSDAAILFGARDGHLFHRLYLRMTEGYNAAARGVYFLTSRRAVTVPAIHNREDILTLLEGAAGRPTYAEFLETRFGVLPAPGDHRANCVFQRESIADMKAFVLDYEDAILARAEAERTSYRCYVASLHLSPDSELFFFDLITSGTVPYLLPHGLGRHVECLCVVMNHPPKFVLPGGFKSFLGLAEAYDRSRHFLRGHYLAESIFTAPDPELRCFDAAGQPIFAEHEDSHCAFARTTPVRDGIVDFVEAFAALAGHANLPPITPQLADEILGMVLSDDCRIDDAVKAGFVVGDRYTFLPALDPWLTVPPAAVEEATDASLPR